MSDNISHWLETAYSRICAGEAEANVLRDYGLIREEAFTIGVEHLRQENERLKAALPYDWDMLEACRGSLREHMAEIKRLREALQWIASRCPTDQFVDLQPHRIHLEAAHDAGACARAALKEVPR